MGTGKGPAVSAPVRPQPRRAGRREQLSDEVAAHLRIGIMSGTLRAGTFIRLDETAAQLGVSITPVREALRTLRGEGMVQLEPHRGHVVAPFSRGDIEDIFWLQSTIAAQLVRSATARITEAELDELEGWVTALADGVERHSPDDVIEAEFAFFRTLNRSAGRIKLAWFLLHATRYLPSLMYADDAEWGARAVDNHRALLAALRSRDADEVVRLTGEQFSDGASRLTARLDELGVWS
jgi:DNA-binding GntR family transcriptional regulator